MFCFTCKMSSLSFLIRMKFGILSWCCYISLLACSDDSLGVVLWIWRLVLDVCMNVCSYLDLLCWFLWDIYLGSVCVFISYFVMICEVFLLCFLFMYIWFPSCSPLGDEGSVAASMSVYIYNHVYVCFCLVCCRWESFPHFPLRWLTFLVLLLVVLPFVTRDVCGSSGGRWDQQTHEWVVSFRMKQWFLSSALNTCITAPFWRRMWSDSF